MPESCRRHAAILQGRSMLVKRLTMLPVEAIVRGYITGSGQHLLTIGRVGKALAGRGARGFIEGEGRGGLGVRPFAAHTFVCARCG
eukprot:5046918-Pleurochrysis_carterae.AAC.1